MAAGDEYAAWMGSKRSFRRDSDPSMKDIKDGLYKESRTNSDFVQPYANQHYATVLTPSGLTPRRSEKEEIKRNLHDGINIMRGFNWNYPPPSSTDGARDDATRGFKLFLTGVTHLIPVLDKFNHREAEKYVTNITDDLDSDWPDVLHFLATMGVQKKTFISQIKFVTSQLARFLPAFAAAAELAALQLNFEISERPEDGSRSTICPNTPRADIEQNRLADIARLRNAGCFEVDRMSTLSRMTTPGRFEFDRLEEMSEWTTAGSVEASMETLVPFTTPRSMKAPSCGDALQMSQRSTAYSTSASSIPMQEQQRQISGDSQASAAGQVVEVAKNGWRRASVYERTGSGMSQIGKLADGTLVRIIDDGDDSGEYAKVEVVCWMKRSYLQPTPLLDM
mmetsp:Transcript_21331/g.39578  ORF Transcript_21331/g.39578 Transcript_21331/m.39578 type:complete len:394 (-) Transcript_21331:94-1275(-)